MKALILCAGLGTRLRPYSEHTPKPLFPVAGVALIDRLIESLHRAGCTAVAVNTHHLPEAIGRHLSDRSYPLEVFIRHEPVILGTGGAIRNLSDFWDDRPFMVVNGDIRTEIDLAAVYAFHLRHPDPATMVLWDYPPINTVRLGPDNTVREFSLPGERKTGDGSWNTFTGIQVLDPEVLDYIPEGIFSSVIGAYRDMIDAGRTIRGFLPASGAWSDLGTPERYLEAVYDTMAPAAFKAAWPIWTGGTIQRIELDGDGSDRGWYRLISDSQSLILAEHGIRESAETIEVDSFVDIGRHLHSIGTPVPEIILYDRFSGLVFIEDLGDIHLQQVIRANPKIDSINRLYRRVIDLWSQMAMDGGTAFKPAWAWQTPAYDRGVIMDRECRYFVDSFINAYLGLDEKFDTYTDEFSLLADRALSQAVHGFIHRDLQSRNIMLKDEAIFFIDFQGARIGPVQYDLASLLIDPYVSLPFDLQQSLLNYAAETIARLVPVDIQRFLEGYRYCRITRNLQMLGAFGFLAGVKGKSYFAAHIPRAVETLAASLSDPDIAPLPRLSMLAGTLKEIVPTGPPDTSSAP